MLKPSLNHFETFLVVAKLKGFSAAARELGISKAAVSHTIRLLERALEVDLFHRSTRQVNLTEEGTLLYQQCLKLKQELDNTRSILQQFHSNPSGNLRVSCNPYWVEKHLLDRIEQFLDLYPDVNIELITEERMPNMEEENIDIVFGINWPAPDDVVAKVIGKTRYILCASPAYLKKQGIPKTIKDLEQHLYIPHLGRRDDSPIIGLNTSVLKLQSRIKLNNASYMKHCAINGMGITQLHDYMVEEEIKKGLLVEVLSDKIHTSLPIYIYYKKNKFVQAKTRSFVKLFIG